MKKIGIFYAAKADKTSWVAEKIQKEFGTSAESVAIENAWQNDFEAYDNFIVGASTWFDGDCLLIGTSFCLNSAPCS